MDKPRALQVNIPADLAAGTYANLMHVSHSQEEFFIDFLTLSPNTGATLTARIITSPGHCKRIARAMADNVRKFEEKFGPIDEGQDMPEISGPTN